jgi:hypothetical protein
MTRSKGRPSPVVEQFDRGDSWEPPVKDLPDDPMDFDPEQLDAKPPPEVFQAVRDDDSSVGTTVQSKRKPKKVTAKGAKAKSKPGIVTNVEIREHIDEDGDVKRVAYPLSMDDIISATLKQTNDWPRRVGNALFVHDPQHGIGWFEKIQDLFGFLHSRVGKVSWRNGATNVKQGEFFAELQRTSRKYIAVEELPHEPNLEGHYYACEAIPAGDGRALSWLVDRFCPATDLDRELILSAFLTPLWGGPYGCRPCYGITSDDGRGVGKTTFAEAVGAVFSGTLQFSHLEDIATIKTRLLSPDALSKRVCLLDNVKSHKFSWAELEALVTSSDIGGRRLYVGESTRPNSLTWFVTLNGACFSTDMAQRSVIIKLRRPERSASWAEETRAFIADHRKEIIGDLIGVLRGPQTPLAKFSRWATWERQVLQRLPGPDELQRAILERQAVVDVDEEESSILEDFFADQLERLEYDPDREKVFIPSQTSAKWFGWATNQPKVGVVSASRQLNQLATEGRLKRLSVPGRSWGRGFLWTGNAWEGTHVCTDLVERIRTQSEERR